MSSEESHLIEIVQNRLVRALSGQAGSKAIRIQRDIAIGSSVGQVRQRNEDCCLVVRASYGNSGRGNFTVAVVCDGLGGMSQGRPAAILAASAFVASIYCSPVGGWETRASRAVAYANSQVYQLLRLR